MSFLRALRAYVGLGPDEDIEDRYLYELNSRRRELDLDELEPDPEMPADDDELRLELESDDVVIVTPGSGGRAGSRPVGTGAHSMGRHDRTSDVDLRFESRDRFDFDELDPVEPTGGTTGLGRSTGNGAETAAPSGHQPGGARPTTQAEDDEILDFLDDDSFAEYIPARQAPVDADGTGPSGPADRMPEPEPKSKAEEAVVRSLDSMRAKPRTLAPESFGDAKLVADEFKRDIPVLLNLQGLERDLARRLIDFASGICYALDGSMEKIASQVFLLIPEGVEVSDEDRRRIEERGYAR